VYIYCDIVAIICLLFFSKRLTSHQCLTHPWLSESLCIVDKLPSSFQANTELIVSSNSRASSRLHRSDSTHIEISVAGASIQGHNLETNRLNGMNCPFSLSNERRCEESGVHNSDSKAATPLFRLKNNGTNATDGNHKTDSEEYEELPVQKRPKNSSEDRGSTTYPVVSCLSCAQCGTQCCNLHTAATTPELLHMTRQHHHSSISNSPVEVILDRGITC
jgi:hypothetical protein